MGKGSVLTAAADDPEKEALRQRVRDLEYALGLNNDNMAVTFRLPKSLAQLLGLLISVDSAPTEMIEQHIEIVSHARVGVNRLRAHLDEWCREKKIPLLPINSRRTMGYWIDDETKARIRDLITTQVTGTGEPPDHHTHATRRLTVVEFQEELGGAKPPQRVAASETVS